MSKLGTLILICPGADDRMSTALRVGVTDLIRAAMGSAQSARQSQQLSVTLSGAKRAGRAHCVSRRQVGILIMSWRK